MSSHELPDRDEQEQGGTDTQPSGRFYQTNFEAEIAAQTTTKNAALRLFGPDSMSTTSPEDWTEVGTWE